MVNLFYCTGRSGKNSCKPIISRHPVHNDKTNRRAMLFVDGTTFSWSKPMPMVSEFPRRDILLFSAVTTNTWSQTGGWGVRARASEGWGWGCEGEGKMNYEAQTWPIFEATMMLACCRIFCLRVRVPNPNPNFCLINPSPTWGWVNKTNVRQMANPRITGVSRLRFSFVSTGVSQIPPQHHSIHFGFGVCLSLVFFFFLVFFGLVVLSWGFRKRWPSKIDLDRQQCPKLTLTCVPWWLGAWWDLALPICCIGRSAWGRSNLP